MKLGGRSYAIQWDIHAWSGVVASVFLFVIFYCGIFALFREELDVWQEPALHAANTNREEPDLDAVLARIAAEAPIARGTRVSFALGERAAVVTAHVEPPGQPARRVHVDPALGTLVEARSRLAEELYAMHFFERVPGGLQVAGLLAVALLVALVTGTLIHLKDLRRQWWQFRPALRLRFSTSDAHKVLGVFGLPFVAMLGWSGAILCLIGLVGQGLTHTVYRGDAARVGELRGYGVVLPKPTGHDAAMLPVHALIVRARTAAHAAGGPRYVDITSYGDAGAYLRVYFRGAPFTDDPFAIVRATDGEVLTASAAKELPPGRGLERVLFDLHFARFGGRLVKLLYALLSLAACAVLVTGNVVWLERRDAARARRGNRGLERLTVGPTSGLVVGSAAYLFANRGLPGSLARRADVELGVFLAVWALVALIAFVPAVTARHVARFASLAAALLFLGTALADLAFERVNLVTALARGLPSVFVAELFIVTLGLGALGLARGLRPRRVAAEPSLDDEPVRTSRA